VSFTSLSENTGSRKLILLDLERILGASDLEVEVRTGRTTGVTNGTNSFALRNFLADGDIHSGHVGVEGLSAVAVPNYHIEAISAVVSGGTGQNNGSRSGSVDRSADRCGDINAVIAMDTLAL